MCKAKCMYFGKDLWFVFLCFVLNVRRCHGCLLHFILIRTIKKGKGKLNFRNKVASFNYSAKKEPVLLIEGFS